MALLFDGAERGFLHAHQIQGLGLELVGVGDVDDAHRDGKAEAAETAHDLDPGTGPADEVHFRGAPAHHGNGQPGEEGDIGTTGGGMKAHLHFRAVGLAEGWFRHHLARRAGRDDRPPANKTKASQY